MSDAERQFHQEAAVVNATSQPERGRLHVHFNVHPFVSLIIAVVICFVALVTWAAYAIFHHDEFVAQTAGLFTDGVWAVKALAIIGMVYLGVIVVGQFIKQILQPIVNTIQLGIYAFGQHQRNKVLTAQANYAIVNHKEGPQFYHVSQDRVTNNYKGTAAIEPAQDLPRLPAPTQQMPTQGYAINQLQHNGLQVCLGKSLATGKPFVRDLIGGTHYKIIGSSGFGKSCYAASILDQVTSTNDPEILSIALLDLEHKTSRLFENLPHVAQLKIGRKLVDCVAQDADEVAEHFGYLHKELDRRAALTETELQRERLLLIYVEEFLSLKYEVADPEIKNQMMADFTILALRARKYRMYLLACAQVSYADRQLREAESQFNVRASFAVPLTGARAAGFIAGELIKKNFEAKVPGQLVLETSGCTDIMLAPQFDVKQKLAELDRSNGIQDPFNGLNVYDFSSAMNKNERIVEAGSSDVERSGIMSEMAYYHGLGWKKQETVTKVCKCKPGGTDAWVAGSAMWDEMIASKNEIGA